MVGVAVDFPWTDEARQTRFARYVEALASSLRHKDRIEPFRRYCVGLLIPGERKSVEPMAARLNPARTAAEHQSLLHFVGQSPWDTDLLLQAVRAEVLPLMTQQEPVASWIIDDTGFPKQGPHSVGVARHYCGELGKQDNCQIAVSLSVATSRASLPIAWRLYLPEVWAHDPDRRRGAKVPAEVTFQTKQEIALAQIRAALAQGVPTGVVLADAGYGHSSAFRDQLTQLGLDYIVGIQGNLIVWPPGLVPAVPTWSGRGRKPTRLRRGGDDAPTLQVRKLAEQLPADHWQTVGWREGSAETLTSRFAAVRVRPAQADNRRSQARPAHWLLVEWPADTDKPTKFWLSNLPEDTALRDLVYHAKQRWLIERDYQELKQELGLGHFEGRGWLGFHHHAALCIAAYGFLVAERAAFPPSGTARARRSAQASVPQSRPRRYATAAT
jgi:SRSO17 transposase